MQAMEDNLVRPKRVTISIALLYISISIWNIGNIRINKIYPSEYFQFTLCAIIITSAILLFLIYMIGKGMDWARMSFFVAFAIFAPQSVHEVLKSTSIDYIKTILYVIELFLIIVAFILSFHKESNMWFDSVTALTRKSGDYAAIPRSVEIAITLLYILIGINIFEQAVSILGYMLGVMKLDFVFYPQSIIGKYLIKHEADSIILVIVKDTIALYLVYQIRKRKNWARIIILTSSIITILPFVWTLPKSMVNNPILLISNLPTYIVIVVAVVYLFQRESNEWFK
jgi:hypothetical protein